MAGRGARRAQETVRITSAPTNRSEDISARQRRYVFSMAIRSLCVVGAVVVGEGVFMWLFLAGAVFLPYIAVVAANEMPRRNDGFTLREVPSDRPALMGRLRPGRD